MSNIGCSLLVFKGATAGPCARRPWRASTNGRRSAAVFRIRTVASARRICFRDGCGAADIGISYRCGATCRARSGQACSPEREPSASTASPVLIHAADPSLRLLGLAFCRRRLDRRHRLSRSCEIAGDRVAACRRNPNGAFISSAPMPHGAFMKWHGRAPRNFMAPRASCGHS